MRFLEIVRSDRLKHVHDDVELAGGFDVIERLELAVEALRVLRRLLCVEVHPFAVGLVNRLVVLDLISVDVVRHLGEVHVPDGHEALVSVPDLVESSPVVFENRPHVRIVNSDVISAVVVGSTDAVDVGAAEVLRPDPLVERVVCPDGHAEHGVVFVHDLDPVIGPCGERRRPSVHRPESLDGREVAPSRHPLERPRLDIREGVCVIRRP